MVQKIALVLVVVLGIVTIPSISTHAATPAPTLRRVDGLVDRSLKELRAAEQFADQKHLGGTDRSIDQGIRMARTAEKTVDRALAMIRRVGPEKVTKAQAGQIERLLTQGQIQLRKAEQMVDRAAQKSEDHKRLQQMLGRVDRQVDEALKLLHGVVAGL